ncbi:MAG: DJ-1/PfpI family protein [Candidatus Aenigmarchaeota archaeon]|nr:DJ-1/PfpI family protein [Candidatus Aenigmarchaeota archaeon]
MVLKGKKVLYIIAQQNFRDEELKIPKEILKKEGVKVVVASIERNEARGMFGMKVIPDLAIRHANPNDYDMLVIAGGSGSPKLADYPEVLDVVKRFREKDKPIATICLASYILAKAGILNGIKVTVYPADFALAELRRAGALYQKASLVVDGKIISAEGPEVAKEFGEKIVEILANL